MHLNLNLNLTKGVFLKRYKRFLADVQIDDKIITVHVPNTGSMKSCNNPNSLCLFSTHNNPDRKIPYTLEAIKSDNTWVGVNTSWPNKIAAECFKKKYFNHWRKFDCYQTEVKISKDSRIDMVLWSSADVPEQKLKTSSFEKNHKFHLIEVKNVTLKEGDFALFPDAVTERGQKHLKELIHFLDLGMTAEMLFIIQRSDCHIFKPAWQIDPEYAQLLVKAKSKGLIITPLVVNFSETEIRPLKVIPTDLTL
jgi:sugar fermentation stimulation protein A